MPIQIYNELILYVNEDAKFYSDKYYELEIESQENNKIYRFFIKNRLRLIFKDLYKLKSNYIIKLHPGIWESESEYLFENPDKKSIANLSFEFFRSLLYIVKIPFRINWNSKKNIPGTVVKFKLAQIGYTLQNITITPNAKIIEKNFQKENLLAIINLKSPSRNGNIDGFLTYSFTPIHEDNSAPWGNISTQDKEYVQKYTQKIPYWREMDDQMYQLLKEPLESTSLLFICYYVYELAKKVMGSIEIKQKKPNKFAFNENQIEINKEFSEFVIKTMRKLKIPIRKVKGIIYPDTFHSWSEVYITTLNQWIPIDPALETFGYLNSLVIPLLIDGLSSNNKLIVIESQNTINTDFKTIIEKPEIKIKEL